MRLHDRLPSSFAVYSTTMSLNWKTGRTYAYAPCLSSGFSLMVTTPSFTSKKPFPTFHFGAISVREKSSSKSTFPDTPGPDCVNARMIESRPRRTIRISPSFAGHHAGRVHLAFVDLSLGQHEEPVQARTRQRDAGHRRGGRRQDQPDRAAVRIVDLDARLRADVPASHRVARHAVAFGLDGVAEIPVGEDGHPRLEIAVGLDAERPGRRAGVVGDGERSLIGREREAVRRRDARVDDPAL